MVEEENGWIVKVVLIIGFTVALATVVMVWMPDSWMGTQEEQDNQTETTVAHFLFGCTRIDLQPKVNKDGSLPEAQSFDISQLRLVKKKARKQVNPDKGGPRKMPTRASRVKR